MPFGGPRMSIGDICISLHCPPAWVLNEIALCRVIIPLSHKPRKVNVTFHTAGALATAAFLSSTQARAASGRRAHPHSPVLAGIGFVAGIVEHGIMDYVPHSYPIPSGLDVV